MPRSEHYSTHIICAKIPCLATAEAIRKACRAAADKLARVIISQRNECNEPANKNGCLFCIGSLEGGSDEGDKGDGLEQDEHMEGDDQEEEEDDDDDHESDDDDDERSRKRSKS